MKQFFFLTGICLLFLVPARAQQIGCVEPGLRLQAREMQQQFTDQGFSLVRDAMIHMASNEPFPVVVELKKGVFYHILFIGNTRAKKLTLDIYNAAEKKISGKTSLTGKDEPNYISFSFTPEESGPYVFALNQRVPVKKCCGSLSILELRQAENQEQ